MQVDAKLLTPNGKAIMGSLIRGIQSQVPTLQTQLAGITSDVPRHAQSTTRVERHTVDRTGPLIGQVIQQAGESADTLAEKLWLKTRSRG